MPQLSPKLSPKAKRGLLAGAGDESLHALVELAAGSSSLPEIESKIQSAGVTRFSWVNQPRFLSVDIPTARLNDLAALNEVVYIEADSKVSV